MLKITTLLAPAKPGQTRADENAADTRIDGGIGDSKIEDKIANL